MPLLGIYPKDAHLYHKDISSAVFIAALFIMIKTWKKTRCPSTKEWVKKISILSHINTTEYYLVVKKMAF